MVPGEWICCQYLRSRTWYYVKLGSFCELGVVGRFVCRYTDGKLSDCGPNAGMWTFAGMKCVKVLENKRLRARLEKLSKV